MRFALATKICFGFAAVLTAIAVGTAANMYQLSYAQEVTDRMTETDFPTALAGASLESDLNRTQNALRGYFLFGEERFKGDRAKAWHELDEDVKELNRNSAHWSKGDLDRLTIVKHGLDALRVAQDQAEALSGTNDNIPAQKQLITEADPRADRMVTAIGEIITEEQTQPADAERKALLGALADTRGSGGLAIGALRTFVYSGRAESKDEFAKRWNANGAAVKRVDELAKLLTPKQSTAWAAYKKDRADFDPIATKVVELRSQKDWNKANQIMSAVAPQVADVRKSLTELLASQKELVDKNVASAHAAHRTVFSTMYLVAGISAIISAATALIIARGISRSVKPIMERTRDIARGDLTGQPLKAVSHDELGDITNAINDMDAALKSIVTEVTSASEEVSAAATEIAASSEEMSSGVRQQSAQLHDVTSAMTEMSASISEVATKSAHAAQTALESGKTAETGAGIVRGTIEDMHQIGQQSAESVKSVEQLGLKSKKIGDVVGVINDVAEQINLLALNAAIEAARAGEHGRGFAVVADEVRKLADRTQTATKEISVSISGIQAETGTVVNVIQGGTQRVDASMKRAASADDSLKNIVSSAATVAELVNSIAATATQQASASDEINRNVEGVAAAAQQGEAAATQCATAATQLSARAENLRSLVSRFKVRAEKPLSTDAGNTAPKAKKQQHAALAKAH